ncbi:hypothetical protein QKW52_09455 [Bacillus sonorensis]|nr:hypothetical protein [Bacillus sonorensis]
MDYELEINYFEILNFHGLSLWNEKNCTPIIKILTIRVQFNRYPNRMLMPSGMEYTVHICALIRMRAKIVALRLQQIGV